MRHLPDGASTSRTGTSNRHPVPFRGSAYLALR